MQDKWCTCDINYSLDYQPSYYVSKDGHFCSLLDPPSDIYRASYFNGELMLKMEFCLVWVYVQYLFVMSGGFRFGSCDIWKCQWLVEWWSRSRNGACWPWDQRGWWWWWYVIPSFLYIFIHSFIHSFIQLLFIYLFIYLLIYPSYLFIYLFICFIFYFYLFIYLFIYLSKYILQKFLLNPKFSDSSNCFAFFKALITNKPDKLSYRDKFWLKSCTWFVQTSFRPLPLHPVWKKK